LVFFVVPGTADDHDDHGDGPRTATVVDLGTPIAGTLGGDGDIDVFRFDLVGLTQVEIRTTGQTDTTGELTDSHGMSLAMDTDSGPGSNFGIRMDLSLGVYYVHVTGTGGYAIEVRAVAELDDLHGDTPESSTRLRLLSVKELAAAKPSALLSKAGRIFPTAADVDVFRIDVPRNQTSVTLRAFGAVDTDGSLSDSAAGDFAMDTGEGNFDVSATLESGIYYLRVSGAGRGAYRVLAQQSGGTFADALSSGGLGPEMVAIPAGSFRMGCLTDDSECSRDVGYEYPEYIYEGRPVHIVNVPRFALSVHEVTFDQWDACVEAGGCLRGGEAHVPSSEGWGRGDRPVINVSWLDARSYVSWLSRATGWEYRLPSEAEWEYAARAGTETRYWWGDSLYDNEGNCNGCGSQWDGQQTAPVGSFEPNPWGLYDIHGNVAEWTADCWHDDYERAPGDGRAWVNEPWWFFCYEYEFVARGGSFAYGAERASSRSQSDIGPRYDLGFRVARSLEPARGDGSPGDGGTVRGSEDHGISPSEPWVLAQHSSTRSSQVFATPTGRGTSPFESPRSDSPRVLELGERRCSGMLCAAVWDADVVHSTSHRDDHGDSPPSATALDLGRPVGGTLGGADDVDVFRFDLAGQAQVQIRTTGQTDTVGELTDAAGASLATDATSGAGDNFAISQAMNAGVYYVHVSGEPGRYAVDVRIVGGGDDLHGDTLESATLLRPLSRSETETVTPSVLLSAAGRIFPTIADVDVFRIDVPYDGTSVTVSAYGTANANGQLVNTNDAEAETWAEDLEVAGNTADANFRISATLARGMYYLRVTAAQRGAYRVLAESSGGAPVVAGAFSDALSSGGLGPVMLVIPGGSFRMGCLNDDGDCDPDEFPVHTVDIPRFALAQHEVTLREWDVCVEAGGCRQHGLGFFLDDPFVPYPYPYAVEGYRPVWGLSWADARSYVAWLSRETQAEYRLPSEAEWEYAARAGTETRYYWGNVDPDGRAYFGRDSHLPFRVGRFDRNAWGLHDMHGNVAEWTASCPRSYRDALAIGSSGSSDCDVRVIRGGSWNDSAGHVRAASRAYGEGDSSYFDVGFRVARTLTP